MKKILLLFMVFILLPTAAWSKNLDFHSSEQMIEYVRSEFQKTVEDKAVMKDLLNFIEENFSEDAMAYPPPVLAYYGALHLVKAKHGLGVLAKMRHLSKGLKILDQAVQKYENHLEVRFVRYSALHKPPDIMNIPERRKADLPIIYEALLRQDYSQENRSLQEEMIGFLLDTGRLKPEQEKALKSLLSKRESG